MKYPTITLKTLRHADTAKGYIDAALESGKNYKVTIKQEKETRSLAQNRIMWKWYDIIRIHIAESGGELFTSEELHEWAKGKFLPTKVINVTGELVKVRRSTSNLRVSRTKDTPDDEVTMNEFLDMLDRHCADSLHLILPRPEDYYRAMRR